MDPKDDGSGLDAERDQALWQLLGRSRPVEASPYFTRRVLRDLDADRSLADESATGWRAWFTPGWIFAGGAASFAMVAAVALALGLFEVPPAPVTPHPVVAMVHPQPAVPDLAPVVAAAPASPKNAFVEVPADVSPQDVDVIADLDNLVAREETKVWTDDTSRF